MSFTIHTCKEEFLVSLQEYDGWSPLVLKEKRNCPQLNHRFDHEKKNKGIIALLAEFIHLRTIAILNYICFKRKAILLKTQFKIKNNQSHESTRGTI